ncbi:MAG: hypothetical protein H6739_13305 [Alphaproteobacteria bacterium]|nr:hypothetical protein [Alphaproteobacteria bacterium]
MSLLLVTLLTGCADVAPLTSRTYEVVDAWMRVAEDENFPVPEATLNLDLDAGTAAFFDTDGVEIATANLDLWPRADWPEGCPTNFSATAMETASLDIEVLDLGGFEIFSPILVAACPDGGRLVLRDNRDVGLDPCDGATRCVDFE